MFKFFKEKKQVLKGVEGIKEIHGDFRTYYIIDESLNVKITDKMYQNIESGLYFNTSLEYIPNHITTVSLVSMEEVLHRIISCKFVKKDYFNKNEQFILDFLQDKAKRLRYSSKYRLAQYVISNDVRIIKHGFKNKTLADIIYHKDFLEGVKYVYTTYSEGYTLNTRQAHEENFFYLDITYPEKLIKLKKQ